MKRLLATLAIPFLLAACGSDDDTAVEGFPRTLHFGNNYQATFNMSDIDNGVADITVTMNAIDGSPLPSNKHITVTPLMKMVSGMTHDTPMSVRSGEFDDNNTFNTTAYFLMPSGREMGDWYFTVEYNDEITTFGVDVNMMLSERQMLQGDVATDKIKDMNNADVGRQYFIFNEGRHITGNMNTFSVYVAARETMMLHTSLIDNITLTGEMAMNMEAMSSINGSMSLREMGMPASDYSLMVNINGVLVEMCTSDCDSTGIWEPANAVADQPGLYKATDLGLTGTSSDVINVRLSVNDEIKTKGDGAQYATFTFDSSSEEESPMTHSM